MTGNTMAEKVVRYMEEKLRQRDAMSEKLRLKNTALKGQLQKVEVQLRQKDDVGDALHYIDFHQLQIENKQYISRLEERNGELLKLKTTTGKTVQMLNNLKKLLHQRLAENEWLSKEIRLRTELLCKIKEESNDVAAGIAAYRRARKKLSQNKVQDSTAPGRIPDVKENNIVYIRQVGSQEMPNVDEYIEQKGAVYRLQEEMAQWNRKIEIATTSVCRARAEAKKLL
ncbi:unnamed protein product [Ascophyllum nodosum]